LLGDYVIPELRKRGADRVARSLEQSVARQVSAGAGKTNLFEQLHSLQNSQA
jgi:hypothetical protein